MIRRLAITTLLITLTLGAQDKKDKAKPDRFDFRPLMQQIWDAWGTLNPANTAKYYSKDAEAHLLRPRASEIRWLERVRSGRQKSVRRLLLREIHALRRRPRRTARKFRVGRRHGPRHDGEKIRSQGRLRLSLDGPMGKRRQRLADHPRACFDSDGRSRRAPASRGRATSDKVESVNHQKIDATTPNFRDTSCPSM